MPVHYRGGKRIDTTQREPERPQQVYNTYITSKPDPETLRRFIREEFRRYIGEPKDWRGRKGTT